MTTNAATLEPARGDVSLPLAGPGLAGAAIAGVWCVVAAASLATGAMDLPFGTVAGVLASRLGLSEGDGADAAAESVVWTLRAPRLLLASLTGAALAIAGVATQGLFRNPLADPGLLGISSGAAVGAVAAIAFGWGAIPALAGLTSGGAVALAAFVGAVCAGGLVVALGAGHREAPIVTMLLVGIAINAAAGAALGAMSFVATDAQLRNITMWTLGSVAGATWTNVALAAGVVAVSGALVWRVRRALDLLQLGEAEAYHAGVEVRRVKRWLVVAAAGLVGGVVAFTGIIGFVGLVVPHIARGLFGPHHARLLPLAAWIGATLLATGDLFARTVVAPTELPIGVVTALLGVPFFLGLILSSRTGGQP